MKRRARLLFAAVALPASIVSVAARAQPAQGVDGRTTNADDATTNASPDIRAHFGIDVADHLIHSGESDDRVRAIERAASLGTPDALALLVHAAEPSGAARGDARVAIELARALAAFADDSKARIALQSLVTIQGPQMAGSARAPGQGLDADYPARLAVARSIAALALARTQDPRIVEWLVGTVRANGVAEGPATSALLVYPPAQASAFNAQNVASPPVLRLIAAVGDLRALDLVRAAVKSLDVQVHATALEALGAMGDMRAVPLSLAAAKEHEARLRVAGATALVSLGVPQAAPAVEKLLADAATWDDAVVLAERVSSPGIVRSLAAHAVASPNEAVRGAVLVPLGRSAEPTAPPALLALTRNPALQSDAAAALARSPSPSAMAAILELASAPATRRLGARAYTVRALVRGETDARGDAVLAALSASRDAADRAVGMAAEVALGARAADAGLDDPEPRVRRAVALATLSSPDPRVAAAILRRMVVEKDEPTRYALAVGLLYGDPDAVVPTLALIDRAESSGPDAALAAMALARRADDALENKVDALLAAPDPIVRAHVARGLAASPARDAVGRLAGAYAYEPDARVRRAVILALAARKGEDATAPERVSTLDVAARLDPDPLVRTFAARAIAGVPAAPAPARTEVAWLRLVGTDGRPPAGGMAGALVRADGLAVPCVFDDDGFALVPGVPPGDAELVLAPRLPAYQGIAR